MEEHAAEQPRQHPRSQDAAPVSQQCEALTGAVEFHNSHEDIVYPSAVPFLLVHAGCLAAFLTGITWQAAAICVGLYWLRMFGIGAGYHRYFSHRAFKTSRVFQFVLAVLAQSSAQKSVLWWAAMHRHHHLHSDTEEDVHSPGRKGFLYSHVGWIFKRRNGKTDFVKVDDFARYPELLWLHRVELLPAAALAVLCLLLAGWPGLVVGFLWSTVLVYHATFCINSLAHVRGSKRYVTGDDSRNNWVLALLTMGEGWHNNHHAYPSSAQQGFKWWEIDVTYYILRGLAALGIVWDLKSPPEAVLRNEQRLGSRVIARAGEQLAGRFDAEMIADQIAATLDGPALAGLRERLQLAGYRSADVLATLHLPQLPTRAVLLEQAQSMFVRSRSFDDIVTRGHELLLRDVGLSLASSQRS